MHENQGDKMDKVYTSQAIMASLCTWLEMMFAGVSAWEGPTSWGHYQVALLTSETVDGFSDLPEINNMVILLMEELLHHLWCIKPCKTWDKVPINWCRISSISSITLLLNLHEIKDQGFINGLHSHLSSLFFCNTTQKPLHFYIHICIVVLGTDTWEKGIS